MSDLDDKLREIIRAIHQTGKTQPMATPYDYVDDLKQAFAEEGYRLTRGMKEGRMVAVPAGEWHEYRASMSRRQTRSSPMKPVKGTIQWIAPELSPVQIKMIEKELLRLLPEKRNNMHELGTFSQDELDQIEKAAIAKIFEANGYNSAIDSMHTALKEYFREYTE